MPALHHNDVTVI